MITTITERETDCMMRETAHMRKERSLQAELALAIETMSNQAKTIQGLEAERDELALDAARYRWIRDRHADEAKANGDAENMDAVIDLAMKGKS